MGHLLLGDLVPWNMRRGRVMLEELSLRGSPKGQSELGFVHTCGMGGLPSSSQSKALVYFTFAALGDEPLAQMALVSREHTQKPNPGLLLIYRVFSLWLAHIFDFE